MAGDKGGARPKARRVTSSDVARAAGVSRATVSYVLNNATGRSISESTRALVIETAHRLGHVPDASARALRLGHTSVILVLVREFTFGYVADQVLEHMNTELTERGYVLMVHRYNDRLRSLRELWPLVDPVAVISMGGIRLPDPESIGLYHGTVLAGHDVINNHRSGEMQIEYLHSRGHRHIGYAYPAESGVEVIAADRLRGSEAAVAQLGLPALTVAEVDRRRVETARESLAFWRAQPGPITAICAHNDEVALMLRAVMAESSPRLPAGTRDRQFALIGLDNIPLARAGLTTIAIDTQQMASRILERLAAVLENRPERSSRTPVFRLIVRDSA